MELKVNQSCSSCTISLIGCGASGAYAPGPDVEEAVSLVVVRADGKCTQS